MTLAEELAAAVHAKQQQYLAHTAALREHLLARRADLHRQLEQLQDTLPTPAARAELEQSLRDLDAAHTATQTQLRTLTEQNAAHRARLWERLAAAIRQVLGNQRAEYLSQEFQQALAAFAPELAGFNPAQATQAEQIRQLPHMQALAEAHRAAAHAATHTAAQRLAAAPELHQQQQAADTRRAEITQALHDTLVRLRRHGLAAEQGLVDELLHADLRVVQRMQREILGPLLTDARIEVEKGLEGERDPLEELTQMLSVN